MFFRIQWLGAVARWSASAWQTVACNPERLPPDEVLRLIFIFPLRQLRRLSLSLMSYLCLPDAAPAPPELFPRRPVYAGASTSYPVFSTASSASSSFSSSDEDEGRWSRGRHQHEE